MPPGKGKLQLDTGITDTMQGSLHWVVFCANKRSHQVWVTQY